MNITYTVAYKMLNKCRKLSLVLIVCCGALISPRTSADSQSISSYNPNNPRVIARREALKAGLDPKLVLAIMWHESRDCKLPTTAKTDLGCMQISRATARSMGLNIHRLIVDPAYNIKAGVTILLQFKRYSRTDKLWWARYNTGYQNLPQVRKQYATKVNY